jgi:hypothetical protein
MDDAAPLVELSDGNLYDRDFYAWCLTQAALLRAGKLGQADIENIAEEIEGLAKTERRELVNRLTVLLLHLLKWRYQAERRSSSWEASIRVQRLDIDDHLVDNPSLKSALSEIVERAYRLARVRASGETELELAKFPLICPWSFDQIIDEAFWPAE